MVRKRQTIDPDFFTKTGSATETRLPQDRLPERESSAPVKATYYLSTSALDALDDVQAELRKLAPQERRALSKSAIVDQMILLAAEYLKDTKTARQFTSKLVNQ